MLSEDKIKEVVDRWFRGRNAIDKAEAVKLSAFIADLAKSEAVRRVNDSILCKTAQG